MAYFIVAFSVQAVQMSFPVARLPRSPWFSPQLSFVKITVKTTWLKSTFIASTSTFDGPKRRQQT
ncbi:hypothetical protein DL98DRAFT_102365 [Cadophora sp. DSE1049]|nr:hypothetical protein DL98DRAFT_102365 [Cadophora sp. DSE1049]